MTAIQQLFYKKEACKRRPLSQIKCKKKKNLRFNLRACHHQHIG
jgi:hypothetical protein